MGLAKKIQPISILWTATYLVAATLVATGCAKTSFSGGIPGENTGSSVEPPPPGGVIKNSYFFVKRTADILFVIDTSGSMAEEQALLQNGFPSFTSTINAYSGGTLDWHIAITSTDIENSGAGRQGALMQFSGMPAGTYFLNAAIPVAQANAAFQSTVTLGTGGSGDERGIAAARMTAQREFTAGTSVGFLRGDTPLSVIVLSDEDERSTRNTASGEYKPLEAIDEPANFISGIRSIDNQSSGLKTITFHSIVTSTQACLDGPGAYMGDVYMELSRLTNGIIGDVCAMNRTYQQQLESLAVNIVNEARTYTLPCGDILNNSISVYEQKLDGALVLVPSSYLAPNKVVLQNPPAVGSLIKAHFTCMD